MNSNPNPPPVARQGLNGAYDKVLLAASLPPQYYPVSPVKASKTKNPASKASKDEGVEVLDIPRS